MRIELNQDQLMEVLNIRDNVFKPLDGFMTEAVYQSVVQNIRLPDGTPWGIPVTFDIPESMKDIAKRDEEIELIISGSNELIAKLCVESIFFIKEEELQKIFGVFDPKHPGIASELNRSRMRIGGRIEFSDKKIERSEHYKTPSEIIKEKERCGMKTLVGFQTRNAVHRAHEYLQRIALEIADGLFIHPLVGWKKDGDASVSDIISAYSLMIEKFYPQNRVLFSVLETPMRYAGPREAIFHAMIRRNYGCTHFIVGRDHAGVGNYYGKYEAQQLCEAMGDLGIKILYLAGPFYCSKCGGIATEKSCRHYLEDKEAVTEISGTIIRDYLQEGKNPPYEFMRKEVSDAILISRREKNKQ